MAPVSPLSGHYSACLEPGLFSCSPAKRSRGSIPNVESGQHQDSPGYHGIPDARRWEAWRAAMPSFPRSHTPGLYRQFVLCGVTSEWARQIKLDVPRTFAGIAPFGEEQQQRLFRMLCAYTCLNPEVGYCQGMNFVGGLILLVAGSEEEEEEVFWFFAQLMNEGQLSGLYAPGFPVLQRYICSFDALMSELEPELREHLVAQDMQPAMYLHHWFLTLFVDGLPLQTVLNFWDVIICSGLESLLKLTASLLQCLKQSLLGHNLEGIVHTFRQLRLAQGPEQINFCVEVVKRSADLQLPDRIAQMLKPGCDSSDSSLGPLADFGSLFSSNVISWWGETKGNMQFPTLPTFASLQQLSSPRLSWKGGVKSAEGAGCGQQMRRQRSACGSKVHTRVLIAL